MGSPGAYNLRFVLFVLVSSSWSRTAQDKLDSYLAGSGTQSLWRAIEDTPVSGTDYAVVTGVSNYGQISYAGINYYGCQFGVEVGVV